MTFKDYCPNCDYVLMVVDEDHYYSIQDYGHNVTTCPNCLVPLRVEGGVLAMDKVSADPSPAEEYPSAGEGNPSAGETKN